MQHQLSCEQVSALLSFYVENKLSPKLSKCIWEHIQNCPVCKQKYLELANMLHKFIEIEAEEIENPYVTKQYEDFKLNLSAYVDNELDDLENIKIKKIAISNPLARRDLENIYSYKRLLHSAFEKTKNEFKADFSKPVLNQLHHEIFDKKPVLKFAATFAALITIAVSGIIYILYF